jgi:hypothetical protein
MLLKAPAAVAVAATALPRRVDLLPSACHRNVQELYVRYFVDVHE